MAVDASWTSVVQSAARRAKKDVAGTEALESALTAAASASFTPATAGEEAVYDEELYAIITAVDNAIAGQPDDDDDDQPLGSRTVKKRRAAPTASTSRAKAPRK